jgi:6-phosphofructokinase 1
VDNDLGYTEMTLGFDTCVNVCVDAVRSIRATSRSHDRRGVVQVMGRYCGDDAMQTAMSTGAEMVIVPEMEWSIEMIANRFKALTERGNLRATCIISEHCWDNMKEIDTWRDYMKTYDKDIHDHSKINAERLASMIEHMSGCETRATVVGYTQRGALPTAKDSAFAFEAGNVAVKLLHEGISNQVIGVRQGRVFHMPIEEALKTPHTFRHDLYNLVNDINQK